MNQNELEKIERTYHQYLLRENNNRQELLEITQYFHLSLDNSRLEDYQITEIQFWPLSIEVIDTKTNTIFTANYSKESEVLGIIAYENKIRFINISEKGSTYERASIYDMIEGKIVLERIQIRNEKYSLFLKKTQPNVINGLSKQDGVQFIVQYLETDQKNHNHELLTNIYKTGFISKKIDSFERTYVTFNPIHYIESQPDHFCYNIDGYITTGTKLKGSLMVDGACFENIDNSILQEVFFRPWESGLKDYSHMDTSLMKSAILYAGHSSFDKKAYLHDLEIQKTDDGISIKYEVKDWRSFPNPSIALRDNYLIPNIENGNITIPEVEILIQELQSRYNNDIFIQFIISELLTFKRKLEIKNNILQEIINPLSPELLMDQSFDDIYTLINGNKEYYFRLASKQLEEEANITETLKKGLTKVLNRNN